MNHVGHQLLCSGSAGTDERAYPCGFYTACAPWSESLCVSSASAWTPAMFPVQTIRRG